LVDVSNPLDFSGGFPPSLSVVNTDSLGEQIQRALPDTQVVKALNTVNADLMVNPGLLEGRHDLFVAGADVVAKRLVRSLLIEFGWRGEDIHDLGGIAASRGMEMYLPLWLAIMGSLETPTFSVHVVRSTHPPG
jgi:predicted dinucleotide-binding enzyme